MSGHEQQVGQAQASSNGHAPIGSRRWEQEQLQRDDIEEIVDSDVLDEATVDLARTLLTRDIPLGNLSDAELTEFRYLLENRFLEILAEHPPEGSGLQGKRRKVMLGDVRRTEAALTGQQRSELRRIKQIILSRATRGKGGWQQDKINERTKRHIQEKRGDPAEEEGRSMF